MKSWDPRLLNLIGIVWLFPVGKRDPEDYDQQDWNESPDNDHEVMSANKNNDHEVQVLKYNHR